MPLERLRRHGAALVLIFAAIIVTHGCGERTNVTVRDDPPVVGGDPELPDAIVTENRPANPRNSYTLDCPFGSVENPRENPYLIGSLGPDQILSIDAPRFLPVTAPDLALLDSEPVIAVELYGEVRAFPVRVLLWHEIVNMCWDTPDGEKYSFISYCPLVDAAVHFVDERSCRQKGKFGVSGGLFNGNLIVFDRATGRDGPASLDLFVQLYGGGLTENCVEAVTTTHHTTFGLYRRLYPDGLILSGATGMAPPQGYDLYDQPYWDYWRTQEIWFPFESADKRLGKMAQVYGVVTPGGRKAYSMRAQPYLLNDQVGGVDILFFNDSTFGMAVAYEAAHEGQALTFTLVGRERHGITIFRDEETGSLWNIDGIALEGPLAGSRLPRVMGYRVFWFAWSSLFPEAEVHIPQS